MRCDDVATTRRLQWRQGRRLWQKSEKLQSCGRLRVASVILSPSLPADSVVEIVRKGRVPTTVSQPAKVSSIPVELQAQRVERVRKILEIVTWRVFPVSQMLSA